MPAPYEDLFDGTHEATHTASGIVFWGDDPTAWDTITLGRFELPGVCRISGNGLQWKTDKKYVPGKNGHTPTTVGREAASFAIVLKLWTAEHLNDYAEVCKVIKPTDRSTKGSKPREAIEISHPALTLYGIGSCLVMNAGLPQPDNDDRVNFYTVRLDCVEFVPQAKKLAEVKTNKFDLKKIPTAISPKVDAARLKEQQSPATQNSGPEQNASFPNQSIGP